MKEQWDKLSSQVEALTVRERVIVMSAIAVGLLFIWGQFFFFPLQERYKNATNSIRSMDQQQLELSTRVTVLDLQLADDPNRELLAQRKGLEQQLEKMKAEIEGQLSGLIAPEKMADVLRTLLADQQSLKLISLKNLPVEPFHLVDENVENQGTALFSHSMELVVDGKYFDVLEYITQLEELKGFNWQMLNYDVVDYPKARVTIKIRTLSLEEDWIGV
ncbi:hypothetical protein [Alkalimarinus sediminis]|uniref:MSHA biogenesis protein MshJ n=1 Tax=Alkalimarinus sediminis TaxID=1632866 RepID=A0A9E8KQ61_9ALTE|nr:hypothetical protein [Alkalimarinus sediminis]UZW75439.1 hypothetical protein NNL22_02215 [Alkalimarinus sediminis]